MTLFRSNLVEGINYTYISDCLFHPEDSPLCPIFRLGDIVALSGFDFETIARVVSEPFLYSFLCVLLKSQLLFVCLVLIDSVSDCVLVSWQGGAIGIVIDWTCNLDLNVKHCKPKYTFHGLYGNPNETDKARASVGYNFRWQNIFLHVNVDQNLKHAKCIR